MSVDATRPSDGVTWNITLDSSTPVEPVRRALTRAGFTIQEFLVPAFIFIVRGTAAQAEEARRISGVIAVEADLNFDVGPPDASIR
jgi:hypothetical protein